MTTFVTYKANTEWVIINTFINTDTVRQYPARYESVLDNHRQKNESFVEINVVFYSSIYL